MKAYLESTFQKDTVRGGGGAGAGDDDDDDAHVIII